MKKEEVKGSKGRSERNLGSKKKRKEKEIGEGNRYPNLLAIDSSGLAGGTFNMCKDIILVLYSNIRPSFIILHSAFAFTMNVILAVFLS